MIAQLQEIVGDANVLTGEAAAPYGVDWTKKYVSQPMAVVRPGSTAEVSQVMALAHGAGTAVVPASGRTGLAGGTYAEGALVLSLERMNKIREIRPAARLAIVEAGVVLSNLHDAAEAEGLVFPLTFGAKGSALIGGALSTNAGGSNVVRYGSTRGLCLGLEVVLADGRVMDLMSELHKDNSGYDLKDLFIGAEGTLGVITGAVLKLFPKPKAYATAMVATQDLDAALVLLNRLQVETGGLVEAFEYMPHAYITEHLAKIAGARAPFEQAYDVNIMVELGATAPRDSLIGEDGAVPLVDRLEETLAALMEEGLVQDAVVAKTEAQRQEMWQRREDAAEVSFRETPFLNNDIAVPTDMVPAFFTKMQAVLKGIDPDAEENCVAHLGDGNIHYIVYPSREDAALRDRVMEAVEDVVLSFGGSFSAEHGIGLSKKPSMARRKNPVAVDVMRALKAAMDPTGILNPGKVIPD